MRIVTCMRWGKAFPPVYVNVLFRAVRDNLPGEFKFVCLTDNGDGLDPGIEIQPIPELNLPDAAWRSGVWPKVGVFKDGTYPPGSRVLFIDLDTMINGSLEPFFERNAPFEAIQQSAWDHSTRDKPWIYRVGKPMIQRLKRGRRKPQLHEVATKPPVGGVSGREILANTMNTSVFAFDGNAHTDICDALLADIPDALQKFRNEQHFVEHHVEHYEPWPKGRVISFKYALRQPLLKDIFVHPKAPPPHASILAFHGDPRPLDFATNWLSSRRELPHVWVGRVKWFRDYWARYSDRAD